MGDKTGIQWTDATWNPTTGCDQVSPGCDHCYAMTMAKRLKGMGQPDYQTDGNPETSGPGFGLQMHPHRLDQPLRWARPRRIFVNSMSDLFHKDVTDEFIAEVFGVMALARQHTFQVLTKRHGRMRALLNSQTFHDAVGDAAAVRAEYRGTMPHLLWPLPNVWLGVSVEDQQWANIRIPALLDTPAAVRFLSCEPLLGSVVLRDEWMWVTRGVHWVIVGGESGKGARPMHPEWARSLRDQCVTAGVPFHFKQWGEWLPNPSNWGHGRPASKQVDRETGRTTDIGSSVPPTDRHNWHPVERVGKHKAGRVLDGRTWDEWPVLTDA